MSALKILRKAVSLSEKIRAYGADLIKAIYVSVLHDMSFVYFL